jgi:hypothetical protein
VATAEARYEHPHLVKEFSVAISAEELAIELKHLKPMAALERH